MCGITKTSQILIHKFDHLFSTLHPDRDNVIEVNCSIGGLFKKKKNYNIMHNSKVFPPH